jgi:outer membrane protein, heavy metal efflux system
MYLLTAVVLTATTELAPTELTLSDAYRRAREAAGAIRAGEARVDEARGRLAAARALRDNPSLEAAIGRRDTAAAPIVDTSRHDLEFGIAQTFEFGGKRGGRSRAATAVVEREQADSADVARLLLAEVGVRFYEAARAREKGRLASASERAAEELVRVARVRLEQGDVAALDVNLAQTVLARARASVGRLRADEVAAVSFLRAVLRLPPQDSIVTVAEAELAALAPEVAAPSRGDLLAARPDLRAADAEVRAARAEVDAARALRWPDATPAVRYSREEGTPILWGGLTVSLPLWNRGDGERMASEARLRRAEIELEAAKARVEAETWSAYDAYVARRAAAQGLTSMLATLDENLELARRSYETGQIGLGELLVVRRETLEARAEAVDLVFDAAVARVQLEAAAGVLR